MEWKICGVSELPALLDWATHIISISSPDYRHEVPIPPSHPVPILQIDMDDVEHIPLPLPHSEGRQRLPPQACHVREIIDFGKNLPEGAHLVIHCQMGISRSTAAMLAILSARESDKSSRQIMDEVAKARLIAMPNRLLVRLADELLHRRGKLVEAVDDHWEQQQNQWIA